MKDLNSPEYKQKAKATRAAQREVGKTLIRGFGDYDLWLDLFKKSGVKCPNHNLLPTPVNMRKYLRRVGVSEKEYKMWTGFTKLDEFAELNPRWPLYAWLGIVCEYIEMREEIQELMRGHRTNIDTY